MVKTLEQRTDADTKTFQLPVGGFSVISHVENIDFCIGQIESSALQGVEDPVIGYFVERALGTRHILHRVLQKERADQLKRSNARFDYVTLNELKTRRDDISRGKYRMLKGLIIGINPDYKE